MAVAARMDEDRRTTTRSDDGRMKVAVVGGRWSVKAAVQRKMQSSSSSSASFSSSGRSPSVPSSLPCSLFLLVVVLALGVPLPSAGAEDGGNYDDGGEGGGGYGGGILWRDLNVRINHHRRKSGNETKTSILLDGLSGSIENGRVCGLIGPSGSGKTTFLSTLLAGTGTSGLVLNDDIDDFMIPVAEEEDVSLSPGEATAKATPRQRKGWFRSGQVWRYHYRQVDSSADRTESGQASDDSLGMMLLEPIHHSQVAYLQQNDDFFELQTVKETLNLAAYLEVPTMCSSKRKQLVQNLLEGLGLSHVANHQIGNARSRQQQHHHNGNHHQEDFVSIFLNRLPFSAGSSVTGCLSGGERRRLSVALELVTEKLAVIADEPTTGLDSARSVQVVKLIRQLSQAKHIPCLLSLHQPRSDIWNHLLDDCILMAPGGRLCYAGSKDDVSRYFESVAGYPIPPATNPAEYLVDLVNVDTENSTQAAIDEDRIRHLAQTFRDYQRKQRRQRHAKTRISLHRDSGVGWDSRRRHQAAAMSASEAVAMIPSRQFSAFGWMSRFGALVKRSWRVNVRNHPVNFFRLFAGIGNAYLLAQIFPTVRGDTMTVNSIADRVALLSFGAINMGMMAYMKTVDVFSRERPVVLREQLRRQYSPVEYLLAKALTELPLDACFAAIFTTVLKSCSGLLIPWKQLTGTFCLLTTTLASLGFALGAWLPSGHDQQVAMTASVPVVVLLMVVGIINPSGVDPSFAKPWFVGLMKQISPFSFSIEALCIGEYSGVKRFGATSKNHWFRKLRRPRMGALALVRNGDQVLQALGLHGKTYSWAMKRLAWITLGNLLVSCLGLLRQQPRPPVSTKKKRREKRPYPTEGVSASPGAEDVEEPPFMWMPRIQMLLMTCLGLLQPKQKHSPGNGKRTANESQKPRQSTMKWMPSRSKSEIEGKPRWMPRIRI